MWKVEDKKRILNLNKIKLYCILHNVKENTDVPNCHNCTFGGGNFEGTKGFYFSSDGKFREFKLGKVNPWVFCGCNDWKKND